MELKIIDEKGLCKKYEIKKENDEYIFIKFEEINNEDEEYTEEIKTERKYKRFMKKLNRLLNKSF